LIRGGIGLFYENVLTVVGFDPKYRVSMGNVFVQTPTACNGTATPLPVVIPGGALEPAFCGTTAGAPVAIGAVGSQIAAFQELYQAYSPFNLNARNPNYVGSLLQQGLGLGLTAYMYHPNYCTPRSVQMNIGVQREIRPGIIFSADFVRNVQTQYFLGVDENHTGDMRYFNKAAAQRAIAATLACAVSSVDQAISACPGLYPGGGGVTIVDFANRGLTSSADFDQPCGVLFGYPCAFPDINPDAPPLPSSSPSGVRFTTGCKPS
jgi:hypothetical protein